MKRGVRKKRSALVALGFATALAVTYAIPAYAAVPGTTVYTVQGANTRDATPQALTVTKNTPVTVNREGYTIVEAPKPQVNVQPPVPWVFAARAATFTNNPSSAIQWPFDFGVPITDGFGYRSAPCSGCSSDHQGLDMAPGAGTPIQAIAAGVVSEVGDSPGGYGVYVMIEHQIDGQTVTSLYAHMQEGSAAMSVGEQVSVRQLVGLVGNTGASTGAHLHLGISIDGTPTDPYSWLTSKEQ
jgi:murein DD-endopeptidase MepM/ murein hydrolase activator NlpD